MKRKQKKSQAFMSAGLDPALQAASFRDLLTADEYEMLLEEINRPLPPAVRINPLKAGTRFAEDIQQKYGWQLEPVPFCSNGYRVLNAPTASLSATLEHHLGFYYIQEVASMLPVELFSAFEGDEIVLDMAASPGGKTTHLISRSADRGLTIANDSSLGRIQALRSVLQNWGAVNYAVTRFPGERLGEWFPEVFDKILLDAPCSMQGLRTAESHPGRPVSEKESRQLSRRQRTMLSSAVQALRVGGEVVYSTCTLLPEEDEMVIEAILRDFAGNIEVTDAQKVLPLPAPGLAKFRDHLLSNELEKSIRLWPHRYQTAGFFACHLRKLNETAGSTAAPPFRSLESVNYQVFSPRETSEFCVRFADMYGFDLCADLCANYRCLVRHFEQVFIFPLRLLERFPGLPVQAAGILLGEDTPEGFLPSQSWASRFGPQCTKGIYRLNETESEEWIKGKNLDVTDPASIAGRRNLIVLNHEGRALGRAAVSGNGLKNLLRRRLV